MSPTTSRPAPGPTTYRLAPPSTVVAEAPVLDEFQQSVVDHPGGPLLVLAGPGTGKTTTLVEAIAARVAAGAAPESILALTFSRKAAEQLRDRVTARVGRTTGSPMASTFHSFAYGLIRAHAPRELYAEGLRLLSAPEQDVVLQELLRDTPESVAWPESLRQARGARGFATEVQAVLARAREKGLDGTALQKLGAESGLPEFVAAGLFLEQYLDVLGDLGATDHADLIRRAVLEAELHRDELRGRYEHVFVDEYQDTDPSQIDLLRALAGDGRNLTVVGDPHQSIYGFRGAEVRGILDFPAAFPHRSGQPADVVVLRRSRRFGPRLQLASQRIAHRLALTGSIGADALQAFAAPVSEPGPHGAGRVEALTFDTERAEAEHLADRLRRAHLEDGIAWADMAVLVRSGRATIPVLRRALGGAGVPVDVASDDTPLVREPAVLPLLEALRAVAHAGVDDPGHPDHVDAVAAEGLLVSPLAGLDAVEVRALARALRRQEKQRAAEEARVPRPSPELLRAAVLDPAVLAEPASGADDPVADDPARAKARAFARLLVAARQRLEDGGTAEEVLWQLWSDTSWPGRLRSGVDHGGAAARRAHRDLDAICALFETAARAEDQRGHTSVATFLATLAAQQIPGDTLAERGVRGDAVRLLTAHRSKGLEWRLVVVAHVQEEGWPDLRRRASLLQADRIGTAGLQEPVSARALLMEERRLFYVACTRARERLLVTAVASTDDDGEQPSRFLAELMPDRVQHEQGRPRRPLSLQGLVAELRRTVADPEQPAALRAAAATRLARLAGERVGRRALVPQADPGSWWGTRAPSAADVPVRPPDEPVTLSASALSGLLDCPAKWFLEREAGGSRSSSQAQGFGNIVHALADRIARGELEATAENVDALMEHVDRVWEQLSFRTPWSGAREREEVRLALARFVDWHHRPGARTVLATEQQLSAEVTLPDGQRVRLHGYADRLEVDDDGHVVVIDLKTGKYPPPDKDLAANPQLGLYQHAVEHGAVDHLLDAPATPGGAELWQLRSGVRGTLKVQPQAVQVPDDDGHRPVELQLMEAATAVREERFEARLGKHCDYCGFHALCPIKSAGTVLS